MVVPQEGLPITPLWGLARQSRAIHPSARRVARFDPCCRRVGPVAIRVILVAVVAAAGCGKAPREQTTAEPQRPEAQALPGAPGAPSADHTDHAPVKPPVKAPSRGPEHAVYSLV